MIAAEVKAQPIIFSAPMVRGILDGRKTQTRRVVKPQPEENAGAWYWPCKRIEPAPNYFHTNIHAIKRLMPLYCPYGDVGDRLWVKESWQVRGLAYGRKASETKIASKDAFHYRATDDGKWKEYWGSWRSPRFMPRWASRITLEITDISVQRVQDISEADAIAEGFNAAELVRLGVSGPIVGFKNTWHELNGKKCPWESNPWVWALTFKVIKGNA